jgi:flagellar FliL protein
MAEEELEAEPVVVEAAQGGMGKKLLFGGIALSVIVAGIFAGPPVIKMITGSSDEADGAEPAVVASKPALYYSLLPPLVVNFEDVLGATHFMQITMDVMSRDQDVINAVRDHAPIIRNNLILLYGNSIYEDVTTRKGKEKMLADGLAEIQKVMQEKIGVTGVEAVYFTSLIIQ